MSIVVMLIGIALGCLTVWLSLRSKARQAYQAAEAESTAQLATFEERLAARGRDLLKLQEAFDKEVAERERLREQNANLKADLEGERRAAQERSESFKRVTEELAEKFKALSRDALKDNNQEFLNLARSTLEQYQEKAKGDLESRQEAIKQVLEPLKKSLDKVDEKIGQIEIERVGAYLKLRLQVESLATDQGKLQKETSNNSSWSP